jgi:hypothetical protein
LSPWWRSQQAPLNHWSVSRRNIPEDYFSSPWEPEMLSTLGSFMHFTCSVLSYRDSFWCIITQP